MAQNQRGSDSSGMNKGMSGQPSKKEPRRDEQSQGGGQRHGEQASQIAGKGKPNEQSRHQDQLAQGKSREHK
jgi:hypothetical protein